MKVPIIIVTGILAFVLGTGAGDEAVWDVVKGDKDVLAAAGYRPPGQGGGGGGMGAAPGGGGPRPPGPPVAVGQGPPGGGGGRPGGGGAAEAPNPFKEGAASKHLK